MKKVLEVVELFLWFLRQPYQMDEEKRYVLHIVMKYMLHSPFNCRKKVFLAFEGKVQYVSFHFILLFWHYRNQCKEMSDTRHWIMVSWPIIWCLVSSDLFVTLELDKEHQVASTAKPNAEYYIIMKTQKRWNRNGMVHPGVKSCLELYISSSICICSQSLFSWRTRVVFKIYFQTVCIAMLFFKHETIFQRIFKLENHWFINYGSTG